jgi:hypothetical protein
MDYVEEETTTAQEQDKWKRTWCQLDHNKLVGLYVNNSDNDDDKNGQFTQKLSVGNKHM